MWKLQSGKSQSENKISFGRQNGTLIDAKYKIRLFWR